MTSSNVILDLKPTLDTSPKDYLPNTGPIISLTFIDLQIQTAQDW